MLDILLFAKKMAPDLLEEFLSRFQVLKTIHILAPTGRRAVSSALSMTERTVRKEVESLRAQGLIEISKSGMSVTVDGEMALSALERLVKKMNGIADLEKELQSFLGVKRVVIVQGKADKFSGVKKDLGRMAAQILLDSINKESILAITGGSTMAKMVEAVGQFQTPKAALVVAARGSVGGKMELQADTLAVSLAKKLQAQYRLLHIPDNLGKKALEQMKNEPNIYAAIEEMHRSDTLIFGVGNAMVMAKKRRLSNAIIEFLERKQVVAEAFGYYFNALGEVEYTSRSIGIALEDAKKMQNLILVAGGEEKSACIMAVTKNLQNIILITDEGAARKMLMNGMTFV